MQIFFDCRQRGSPADRGIRTTGHADKFPFGRESGVVVDELMQQFEVAALQEFGDRAAQNDWAVDHHMQVVDGKRQIVQIFHPPGAHGQVAGAQAIEKRTQRFALLQQRGGRAIGVQAAAVAAVARLTVGHDGHVLKDAAFQLGADERLTVDHNRAAHVAADVDVDGILETRRLPQLVQRGRFGIVEELARIG